jgi:uncharacterized protein
MPAPLRLRLDEEMKAAMRAKEKARLGTIRLILAAIKQREVDERKDLDDSEILVILDRMVKQRRDSVSQFEAAGREDLASQERSEIEVIQSYLPAALGESELNAMIDEAIAASGATSGRDMGKVMALLKPKVQGRADMAAVGSSVKSRLPG